MAKKQKQFRPKPRSPRGFVDRLDAELAAERQILSRVTEVYRAYGYDALETPAFEYADALGKFLPDADRPNQGVFSLQDDDDQWMSLRYDLTAPLARFVAAHYDALPKPFRRYQTGRVWRNEKPGPGRFREFTQCDADSVGAPGAAADAEMCMMLAEAMEAAGVARGDYVVRINNRKALNGLLQTAGLAGEEDADKRLTVLRAMDKLDRLGEEGVKLLLGGGRKDASGDFTEGAGLSGDQIDTVMAFMTAKGANSEETVRRLADIVGGTDAGAAGVEELAQMAEIFAALGFGDDRMEVDLSVVRGLEYYTGPVFEAELTFEVEDDKGRPIRFGSVGSGGRYDDLVKRFKGVEVPATGVSVGVSRLISALQAKGALSAGGAAGPVIVLALEADRMAAYQGMAAALRAAGVRAEVYLGGAGMRAQVKYADKRAAPLAVIQGEDERAAGEVTIKDLVLGAQLSSQIGDNKAWREDQPAQFSVSEDKLVDAVKETLARHRSD
ncbi:MAG: histidine--tRNA ligase [Pseudomonadota bacterium]